MENYIKEANFKNSLKDLGRNAPKIRINNLENF